MKRIVVVVAVLLSAANLLAAQCKGVTQKGERCKREAAEGSEYCIGHAGQAKAAEKAAEEKAKPKTKAKAKPAEAKAKAPEAKAKAAAEKPAEGKMADDGTCWAMTEAGTRCKHKKDGESDYCKQHGADVQVKKPLDQCRALTWEGKRCPRKPEAGYLYCKQHRKQPAGAPKAK